MNRFKKLIALCLVQHNAQIKAIIGVSDIIAPPCAG